MADLERAGSAVLYSAATGLERAMADLDGAAFLEIRAELIVENWDPWLVQERNLWALAYALGVTLWDDNYWSMSVKRAWLAQQWEFKAKIGTYRAMEMAVGIEHLAGRDMAIMDLMVPPQGLFLAGPPLKDEWDVYLSRLPELRTYLATYTTDDDGGLYLDAESYIEDGFLTPDRGVALGARVATIHYGDGREINLRIWTEQRFTETGVVRDIEFIFVPGAAGAGLFLNDGFLEDGYLDGNERDSKRFTFELDRLYSHENSTFPITVIVPSLEPQIPRYMRGSREGTAYPGELMLDNDYLDDAFISWDRAEWLVFDMLRLFDPDIEAPLGTQGDFLDDARLGFPSYTAEVLVRAARKADLAEGFLDELYLTDGYVVPDDLTVVDRAYEALKVSKALRDTVLVSFETTKVVDFGAAALRGWGATRFGERIQRYL